MMLDQLAECGRSPASASMSRTLHAQRALLVLDVPVRLRVPAYLLVEGREYRLSVHASSQPEPSQRRQPSFRHQHLKDAGLCQEPIPDRALAIASRPRVSGGCARRSTEGFTQERSAAAAVDGR